MASAISETSGSRGKKMHGCVALAGVEAISDFPEKRMYGDALERVAL